MSKRSYYERRCPFTGEILDKGPESQPGPADDIIIAAKVAERESRRGRLLQCRQECSTAQTSADDDLPFTDMDMDFDK